MTANGTLPGDAAGAHVRGDSSFRAFWVGEGVALAGSSVHAVALPVLAGVLRKAAAAAAGATQRSIRQQLCPPELQSRAQQTSVWLVTGLRPFAALTAGGIAAVLGVHAALATGTVLSLVPGALLWSSPVRRMTAMPAPDSDIRCAPSATKDTTCSLTLTSRPLPASGAPPWSTGSRPPVS
ncbi:hypothetical protein [Streptomyces sp. NPDC058745]|uniref:hypothetical protein n=1 Tax=Streptomyces sp. NPDC058745 TaxID=3346621 RepID=UPI00367ED07E